MHTTFSTQMLQTATKHTGVLLSVAGLVAWLAALLLAVTGPILGFEIPAPYLLGAIVSSAAFSVAALPRLMEMHRHGDK